MNLLILLLNTTTLLINAYTLTNQVQQELDSYGIGPVRSFLQSNPNYISDDIEYSISLNDQEKQRSLVLETDLFDVLIKEYGLESTSSKCIITEQEKIKDLFQLQTTIFSDKSREEFLNFYNKVGSIESKADELKSKQDNLDSSKICECLSRFLLVVEYLLKTIKINQSPSFQIPQEIIKTEDNNKKLNITCLAIQSKTICKIKTLYQSKEENYKTVVKKSQGEIIDSKLNPQKFEMKGHLNSEIQYLFRRKGGRGGRSSSSSRGRTSSSKKISFSSKHFHKSPPSYSSSKNRGSPPPYTPSNNHGSPPYSPSNNHGSPSPYTLSVSNNHWSPPPYSPSNNHGPTPSYSPSISHWSTPSHSSSNNRGPTYPSSGSSYVPYNTNPSNQNSNFNTNRSPNCVGCYRPNHLSSQAFNLYLSPKLLIFSFILVTFYL